MGWQRCLIRQQRPKAAGRVGGEKSQHPAAGAECGVRGAAGLEACAAGEATASFGPLLASDMCPSEAAGTKADGRTHILTHLLAARQDTQRGRNKTLEIPRANRMQSVTPTSSNPIRSQYCIVDASLIQSYVWCPGRGPPPQAHLRLPGRGSALIGSSASYQGLEIRT